MKSILLFCAALSLASSMVACSVYMEATRPTPTDLNYFQVGMTRDQVLAKLGAPDTTQVQPDQTSCDFYKLYTRGYGAGGKVPIAVAEAAADFFTIGLAEAALTPTEGVTKNEKHPVQFCYKGQDLVRIVADTPPTASPDQNPPITAASSDGAATNSSSSGTATATASPSPGGVPTATASPSPTSSPTPQPSPSSSAPQE
jgi:SmpA / OmlA family